MSNEANIRTGQPAADRPSTVPPPAPTTRTDPVPVVRHDGPDVVVRKTVRYTDRIRWSAIWAGLVVALGIYLFLQLTLVATGVVELADASGSDAFWSAAAALVAFLVGGVTTGASARWHGADDGLLHGIVLWAVGLVALLTLAAFGGGIALGSFDTSDVFDRFSAEDVDSVQANEDAEEAAGWAIIGLASALAAAAVGASIGAKLWPRDLDDDDDDDLHTGQRSRTSAGR